jgi:uncharacterized protein (TIGR02117 family)
MKILRKIIRGTGIFLESLLAFLFVYLVIAVFGAVIPVGIVRNQGDVTIYVQSNGVHTDVILPVQTEAINWLDFIPIQDYPEDVQCDYVVIGWGDKGFFLDTPTWADLKFSTAFNAAFLPSDAAMHVAYCTQPIEDENHRKIHISKAEYLRMVRYVKGTFLLKNDQVEVLKNAGYTAYDRFYEAKHSYHLFHTCNSWTNGALKAANIRTGILALFPGGIMDHLPN